MLSLLDKYLYDNPKQHTHCMSSDNEYLTQLKYVSHRINHLQQAKHLSVVVDQF